MITRIVKMEMDPDATGLFMELFGPVYHDISVFPGCIELQLLTDVSSPGFSLPSANGLMKMHLTHIAIPTCSKPPGPQ